MGEPLTRVTFQIIIGQCSALHDLFLDVHRQVELHDDNAVPICDSGLYDINAIPRLDQKQRIEDKRRFKQSPPVQATSRPRLKNSRFAVIAKMTADDIDSHAGVSCWGI